MKNKYLLLSLIPFILLSACEKSSSEMDKKDGLSSVASGEASPRSEALQRRAASPPSSTTPQESPTDHIEVHFNDPMQDREMGQLLARISDAKIEKVHVANLEPGAIAKVLGTKEKKILVWNGAGRQLYSSIEEARKDGFAVWSFEPDSEAIRWLDNFVREEGRVGGYSDDLLVILWDGLEFAVTQ